MCRGGPAGEVGSGVQSHRQAEAWPPHLWQSPQLQGQGLLLYFGLGGLRGGLTGDLLTLVLY